jgi:hydrogenase/urease accessory protein HupE
VSRAPTAAPWLLLSAVLLSAMLRPTPARAHQGSVSYAEVAIGAQTVDITFDVAYEDWLLVLDVDSDGDGDVTTDEVTQHLPRLGASLRLRTAVVADGQPCPGAPVGGGVTTHLDAKFILVRMTYACPAPIRALQLGINLFVREHPGHRTLARIVDRTTPDAGMRQYVFGEGIPPLDITRDAAPTREPPKPFEAARQFVGLGVEHIFTGYDHILFLLGLLLGAASFRDLLKIVTSFTLAHTITLVLATLGYVSLGVRLVESVIALSIAYVAIENLVAREHRRRWMLAFLFGLVHGFGFSNVLREMSIPRAVLGWSLGSFNLGVELGQVVIVSLLYPAIAWSRGRRWNRQLVQVASVAIGLMGLYWFVERALLAT